MSTDHELEVSIEIEKKKDEVFLKKLQFTQIRVRKYDNKSCEGIGLRVKTVSHQNLKNV